MSDEAENSQENSRNPAEHLAQYCFKPGQSGNPGGRPKKKPITDLYEEILNDPEAIDDLRASIRKMFKRGQMAAVLQLKEMAERVEGKVTQPIEADVNVNCSLSERMQKARQRVK